MDAALDGIWNDVASLQGSTKTNLGLDLAASGGFGNPLTGDRPDKDNLAVVLTDGPSHTDVVASSAALRAKAKVVAMGIDMAVDEQLRQMVNYDEKLWFKVPLFTDLAGSLGTVLEWSCGRLWSFSSYRCGLKAYNIDVFLSDHCPPFSSDPCEPNPCLNGGTCNGDLSGTYTCDCDTYWSGPHCEIATYGQYRY